MRHNVEIKARIEDMAALTARVKSVADQGPETIMQEDTFFNSAQGRLKLRKIKDSQGELIYYERPDTDQPVECRYRITPTSEPNKVIDMLSQSHGIKGVVRKKRTLFMAGQTRIHLDEVDSLGAFLELEVVLRPNQNSSDGVQIAEKLMNRLGVGPADLVEVAYIDLLLQKEP